jgi:hypothetical protein
LIEINWVLKPGGFWILSGPPVNWKSHCKGSNRTEEDLKAEQDAIEDGAQCLCWKKYTEKGGLAIWQKPFNHIECENNRKKDAELCPHICSKSENPDTTW